ncbi:Protein kinase domain - like 10 [Theobroma cacao]|nr:Protein kinase domain - like 10 [Theobroma cacao]
MPTKRPKTSLANQYLGLSNDTSNGQILAVEFDVVQNLELQDINDNHVGIDISSPISNISEPAAYYSADASDINDNRNNSIILKSGKPIQAWIDYDSKEMLINMSTIYVGFSGSTGILTALHYVHGWSFSIGGRPQDLDPRKLPFLKTRSREVVHRKGFAVGITLASITLVFLVIIGAIPIVRKLEMGMRIWRIGKVNMELGDSSILSSFLQQGDWFGERNLVGSGGFGRVYRGAIHCTRLEVAIKRVSSGSCRGMKEFVAQITSMGRLRHRNLVQLHGWCRKEDELLLVYDYVPNGSLDKLLYQDGPLKGKKLTWDQRYKILTGVAQALLYLHEECDQRVVHRDVKPSNVLIDEDLNAKLGEFGLARTYEHDIKPQTTHIVGTLGYLAPELTRTGKATTSTDVYGYGTLMLEVASRRRPIEPQNNAKELLLVDWVRELHSQGEITKAIDPTLDNYHSGEAELVLTLGLLCCHPHPDYRPTMRRVVQFLLGDAILPPLPRDIHLEVPMAIPEYSDSFPDDSDPSCLRMASSQSNSFTSFDKKLSSGSTTRVTF